MEDAVSYLIFSADTLLAIITFLYAVFVSGQAKAVELENRLTKVEANQFTEADKNCLHELDLKMKLFWGIVETEFPIFLRRDKTPQLDILLDKARVNGVKSLTFDEVGFLDDELKKEYKQAIAEHDSGRALAIAFYSTIVKYTSINGSEKNGCKT